MQSEKRTKMNVRLLTFSALLCAMSIVLGKYLAIRGGEILRFSFENLPVILAGIFFGPVAGALVGVVADLLGCLLVGYAINPIVTLGAFLIGLCSGLLWRPLGRISYGARVALCVGASHLFGSVLVKTIGLSAFYDMPLGMLMLWRLLNYAIVGGLETLLVLAIVKNKAVGRLLRKEL